MRKLILLSVIIVLSSCSINDLVDQRGKVGCYVAGAQSNSALLPADVARTAVWCSDGLPDNFRFTYDDGRTKLSIGE